MQPTSFRYYQLKVSAQRLPGKGLRLDPLAVVFTGGPGKWQEVGRTEKRLNEWNPKFAQSISLPADSDAQKRVPLRIDFYNKSVADSRFLGTCELNMYSLIAANGRAVEFELATPAPDKASPRVFVAALEGFTAERSNVSFSLELAQTHYYGVAMKIFYEIARAGNAQWYPVFKSATIPMSEQGWAQFPAATVSMQDLAMNEEGTGLLFNLYRFRKLGPRKLLGYFQTSVKALSTMMEGDFLTFTVNEKEDLAYADVQLLHRRKLNPGYDFAFKLVNVRWKAVELTEKNAA